MNRNNFCKTKKTKKRREKGPEKNYNKTNENIYYDLRMSNTLSHQALFSKWCSWRGLKYNKEDKKR